MNPPFVRATRPHKELQRIEVFSDGVFAIACTLLVLEFRVPEVGDVNQPGALWPALRIVWPVLAAYFNTPQANIAVMFYGAASFECRLQHLVALRLSPGAAGVAVCGPGDS
jgi:uncharacterized membrane protein